MIAEIASIVEKACAQETNIFGYGIWTHHITQVVQNGNRLARLFGADIEIVEPAALLHDYASIIDQVPSLLRLAFVQRHMGIDKGARWVRAKLERSWHKQRPPTSQRRRQ